MKNQKKSKEDLLSSITSELQTVSKHFSIDVTFQTKDKTTETIYGDSYKILYEIAEEKEYEMLLSYARLFKEEFMKYPKKYVEKIQLKSIKIVKDLSFNKQFRAAIPNFLNKSLLLDFKMGNHNKTYQRHVIHHELFHHVEYVLFGDPYRKDEKWKVLNKKNFKYGSGGVNNRTSNQYSFSNRRDGFINLYSETALEEDKAEIYASLFVKEEIKEVLNFKKTDLILKKKVKYMKTFLEELKVGFDKKFWKTL